MILNLCEGIFPTYLQVSDDSKRNKMINDIFQDNKEIIFLSSGELLCLTNIYTLKMLYINLTMFKAKMFWRGNNIINDVIYCGTGRFFKDVKFSKDSHGSKMFRRFYIFGPILKIQDLRQFFVIGEDVMNILYLQWVEVTPQLCKFPSVWSKSR